MANVPRTPEDLTASWLGQRLAEAGRSPAVGQITSGPLEGAVGFQGNFARIEIEPADAGDAPETLVAKMVPENEQLRALGRQLGIYAREAMFYLDIGDDAGLPVPVCFGAAIDPETGDSAIVLEDLSAHHTGNQYAGFSLDQAERAIAQYAAMHATWWDRAELSAFDWLPPWNMPEMVAYLPSVFPPAWQACMELYGNRLDDEDRSLGDLLGARLADLMNHAGTGPVTLVHGDARHDNLMFPADPGTPPHFVDWQYVASGRGALDIAYYLTQGGDAALVAPIEQELVQRYHEQLLAGGVTGYGWDACWSDYRRFALYMLVFPIFTVAMIDPTSDEQREALYIILRRGLDAAKRLGSADIVSG